MKQTTKQSLTEEETTTSDRPEESFAPWGNAAAAQDLAAPQDDGTGILGAAEEEVDEVGLEVGEIDMVELGLQVDAAGTAAGQVVEARIDVLDDLHNDAAPVRVPSTLLTAIELAAVASTGAASAGIAGSLSAKITNSLNSADEAIVRLGADFVKATFKDLIDGRIDGATSAGVGWMAKQFHPLTGGPAHEAYFRGQMIGLRTTVADAEMVVKRQARKLALGSDEPVEVATAFAAGLKWAIVDAPPKQQATGISEWLNLNAQMDLGAVEEDPDKGADLGGMEWDKKSWQEILLGEPAYGVLRAGITGLGTANQEWNLNEVYISGTSPEFVEEILQVDQSIEEMGLNMFVSGDVYQNVGVTSWVEFGKNDAGKLTVASRDDMGEAWLGFFSREQHSQPVYVAPSDPMAWRDAEKDAEKGASMILWWLMQDTPKELNVKHG